jgi:2-C-methyl-D-erythritol 2,4-cyclodiphosphate synthase
MDKKMSYRIGYGYDVHRFTAGNEIWIGGIRIPHDKGILAHSDGDVLLHAICDAMLGAAKLRDIGFHFPDTSPEYKNVDSKILLEESYKKVSEKGFRIVNVDATVAAQRPKLMDYIPEMELIIARILGITADDVSIKATTTEKLGFEGREEGISAHAVVLLKRL